MNGTICILDIKVWMEYLIYRHTCYKNYFTFKYLVLAQTGLCNMAYRDIIVTKVCIWSDVHTRFTADAINSIVGIFSMDL